MYISIVMILGKVIKENNEITNIKEINLNQIIFNKDQFDIILNRYIEFSKKYYDKYKHKNKKRTIHFIISETTYDYINNLFEYYFEIKDDEEYNDFIKITKEDITKAIIDVFNKRKQNNNEQFSS